MPEAKSAAYRKRFKAMPKVHLSTLKKLLGHLLEIVSHEDRNLASLDNISKTDEQISLDLYSAATKQAIVTHDLIFYYCEIFGVDAEEILAKCKLDVIREQKPSKNPANGLLIPIHLFERDNKCFNVQSEWTAAQVVSFKIQKLAFVSPCESYALFEVVKNGQLERRIGANESLRSIVLGRWMDWVEEQQKDNFLLFKKDMHPFQPQSVRAFAEDLKLAEPGSRTFKSASLRIEDGVRVCQYSRGMRKQCQWKVDEMFWFVGAESDRRCPYPHPLTFFVSGREKRAAICKGKFPGYCVAFKDEIQRLQWLNQVIVSTQEYLPMPIIHI
uniref:Ras-associating domain-containing protein n=1 Tax=Globodera pallida TaxID=36090 RepID=A0A183BW32_GLOPA